MMKKLIALAVAGLAASAAFADTGLKFSGDVHATNNYVFRGQSMSNMEPSIGGSAEAEKAGFFGRYDFNTVKLGADTSNQMKHIVAAGYSRDLGNGLVLGGGLQKAMFSGENQVNDLAFGEAFVFGSFKGVTAKLARNIDSDKFRTAGFNKGDMYGEVGYTYTFSRYSVGGDVGYYWYDNYNAGAKDGFAHATLRAAAAIDDHFSVGVAYQVDGHDAAGQRQNANNNLMVNMNYSFK